MSVRSLFQRLPRCTTWFAPSITICNDAQISAFNISHQLGRCQLRQLCQCSSLKTHTMTTVPWSKKPYPETRRTDHVEIYKSAAKGEIKVSDPYVWLEDTTPETEEWVSQQEAFTRQYLDQLPDRERLEKAIRANMDYPKFSAPGLRGDHWYWYYNSGLQAQSIMYRSSTKELPQFFGQKDDGPGGEVFFDVNLLSEDGTAALATSAFSRCGKYFAYGISRSGSDFCTIYIRSTDSPLVQIGEKRPSHDDNRLSDELRYVKFSSISWTADSKGFFYQRFPTRSEHGEASSDKAGTETNIDLNAALYYHRVGTPQSEDVLVMDDPEHPHYMWHVSISETEEGRWAYLSISRDTMRRNPLWVADLTKCEIGRGMPWIKLVDNFDAEWHCITQHGTKLILSTNKDAPRHKLVSIDIAQEPFVFTEIVPEDPDGALLKSVQAVQDDKMMVVYQRNVMDELYVYSQDGTRLTRLGTEFVGSLSVTGKQTEHKKVFVTMAGFTTPGTVALYDLELPENERKMVDWRTTVLHGLNPTEFSAEQVWYPSKDGTKIPMFIIKHSSTVFDGTAPAIQYGYGGFDISITPSFSPSVLTWLQAYGGVYVVANIRGGGEFGDEWHHGGMREKKHNCFDDFIAATRYLEEHKYVGKGRVAINGGSNGGLLVAASVFRAPEDTFGAAVAEVGVHDYLKFHRFTIGRAWTADYGNPDDPTDFDFMYPISPVHNVPTNKILPPMMLHTADHDDRVVPLHSFKLAAALQHAAPENENPLLLRIEKKAGHGAGKSTEQRVKEAADKWAFVANAMGCKWRED